MTKAQAPLSLPILLLLGSIAPLLVAFASQYFGGLQPCTLCIWQRYGYGGAIALGLITLALPRRLQLWGAVLTSLALLVVAGLALFHVGVEQHWWQGLATCTGNLDVHQSVADLEKQLMDTPVIPCDRPAWTMFGISMAGYDFIYAALLGLFGLAVALRSWPMSEPRRRLPGDLTPEQLVERVIRVDQAGEYGARRIYEGQLAVLQHGPDRSAVEHMAEQEGRHLAEFDRLLGDRRVRPTALQPLWHVAGFALGAATALLGPKAAMACTVAVEEVIDEHYRRQGEALPESEGRAQGDDRELPPGGARASRHGPGSRRRGGAGLSPAHQCHQDRLAPRHLAGGAVLRITPPSFPRNAGKPRSLFRHPGESRYPGATGKVLATRPWTSGFRRGDGQERWPPARHRDGQLSPDLQLTNTRSAYSL